MIGPFQINEIYCGDNVELCRQLPSECIDLTVTSPPYDNLRTYNEFTWDFEALARELYRITKEGGVAVWVVADATVKGSETGTSFRQALYFMECGFNLHDTMIWKKPNPIPVDPRAYRYTSSFEYMFIFSKKSPRVGNLITERSKHAGKKSHSASQRRKDGSFREDRRHARRGSVIHETKTKCNVWSFPSSSPSGNHPATFPEKLARDHIISWSNPDDTILDPFMGSGTTAKVALQNGRRYLGFEISQEYVDLARKRVAQSNPPLLVDR